MSSHHILGRLGEQHAVKFLLDLDYKILETNYRYGRLEADIIAFVNNTLVIIEVKTRSNNYFGEPQAFVTKDKQQHMITLSNHYIELNNLNFEVRFDIIAILKTNSGFKIEHIEDAFQAY